MANEKAILSLKNRTVYRGTFLLPVMILTLNHQVRSIPFFSTFSSCVFKCTV